MNLPLLSDNTFLLRSWDLILKGLEIEHKASHMLRKSFTTEQQLLSQVFWTGAQRKNSAKLTKTVAKPGEGKQIHVSDILKKDTVCFFGEPVYEPSSSSAGVYLKKCVCFFRALSTSSAGLLSQLKGACKYLRVQQCACSLQSSIKQIV